MRKGAETTAGTNDSVFDKFLPAVETKAAATLPSTPPSPRPSTPARKTSTHDISPRRDFQKVANSITREAIPAGMFNGKAKQLYDCLYAMTRGAIVPSLTVRISRAELMKKSGIGAKVTLEQNLRRLSAAGLVTIKTIGGIQGGNEYSVYLPEEVTLPSTPPSPPSPPSGGQNLGVLAPLETSPPSPGLSVDSMRGSEDAKTSFKTNTIDDEGIALSDHNSILAEAAKKLTGRAPRAAEREQWAELARVLVEELNAAASRAESVSNVPAFLTAHLRRKLAQKPATRKGEGKQRPSYTEPPALQSSTQAPEHRLTPEDVAAYAATVSDLLIEGRRLEEVEAQFAGSMHPEDWQSVRDAVSMEKGS